MNALRGFFYGFAFVLILALAMEAAHAQAEASTWVWTCTGTRGQSGLLSVSPTCSPSSAASWVQLTPELDASGYTKADLLTAGLLAVGAVLLVVGFTSGKQR